jgi:hypothetical protein
VNIDWAGGRVVDFSGMDCEVNVERLYSYEWAIQTNS